ncbi:MAG: hypothetical protein COU63_02935 [Candidatus Pacebacteria bacterium CG10_big_fil_rev_8_21_14_0_10_36_11]|nr:hypothetical protein [Candidatus Pacearchaeota archaeon]OIP74385.1 MAG: hypothetical protein AUK08_01195 [Candidatus Pacebacteria bacterium CG2_30_36_39]PIR64948.1 MAG: hypothetical protein COU63_02935 [Candidatus Pacebacteria bacterium CG10_big_fil_rev_8_21_14_0_10_36_11]PJC43038.1 MAG: hypothetical protein CO040_01315 [Candidatus Pacebacteria bacterium CG_4_9_14_0_2_um_filter_36_8]
MTKQPIEAEIQKVLKMLEESDPANATRENAIKVIEGMKTMASGVIDKIDDDLKTGKVKVSDDGKVTRKG